MIRRHEPLDEDADRPADDHTSRRPIPLLTTTARTDLDDAAARPPRRRRDPRWAHTLVTIGAVMMMLSGSAFVAKNLLVGYVTSNVRQDDLIVPAAEQQGRHVTISGAKTILLVGIDPRPDQDPSEAIRSDSIIIVHIPQDHQSAYLVSIPRDTWVRIPPFSNGRTRYQGGHDKINAAFAEGGLKLTGKDQRRYGMSLLADTIEENWGITFDAAAIVDFAGFTKVVDVLGGVDMYVDQETRSVHIGHDAKGQTKVPYIQRFNDSGGTDLIPVPGVTPQTYHVGYQHLEPWQALDYVRQRDTLPNSDYDRQRHQQQFIKALFKEIASRDVMTDPAKLKKVLDVVGQSMTIDSGGIDLQDWIFALKDIGGDNLLTVKSNNGTFHESPEQPGAEALDDNTLALLAAVRADSVESFMSSHVDLVSKS
ncbi:LCP family protein [Dactylosporangium sp. CA-139066]|uniref:LCP family protein n=1 Tax=Dactylosporangium sp. CA-139066 TaxID=3239930 RepID=UPI003D8A455E